MKIDMILTLNTPHRGPYWWNPFVPLAWSLNKVWVVRKLLLLRQLADLAPWSENLTFLQQNWKPPHLAALGSPATEESRYIYSVAISGLKDWFVSKRSAERFEGTDERNSLYSGHSVDDPEVAKEVGRYLYQHQNPVEVERELRKIYSQPGLLNDYRKRCLGEAAAAIKADGFAPGYYVDRRAACFVDDFKDALDRHPLRKLGLIEAFRTYVKKVLED